jgi:hypothetical protein
VWRFRKISHLLKSKHARTRTPELYVCRFVVAHHRIGLPQHGHQLMA